MKIYPEIFVIDKKNLDEYKSTTRIIPYVIVLDKLKIQSNLKFKTFMSLDRKRGCEWNNKRERDEKSEIVILKICV
ncbi:hypothetical protein NAPIS_ORF00009 [Vairimorpha apis BRL 01]|uniref:Uncharacterized protein n=1 Tax=Vairimorpha apis BRL 01 TaxID=1037528 RepID=T0MH27_9MICR|nr:hypothetical protein NAPIS_ORF00009 [Vairimorpha apis BRL 01]